MGRGVGTLSHWCYRGPQSQPYVADAGARIQATHVFDALLHVGAGGLFRLLAPLQFWRRLRNSHRTVHRWSGRLLLILLITSVAASVPFGILAPYAGAPEGVIVTVVALLTIGGAGRAYWAIRTQRVALHREWMLRVFALAAGIASVRLVDAVLILLILPLVSSVTIFVLSLWLGWGLTLAGVEWWIVRTRRIAAPFVPDTRSVRGIITKHPRKNCAVRPEGDNWRSSLTLVCVVCGLTC